MRKTLIPLITVLVITSHPIASSAQSFIKGTVISSSGYGLPYATVKIAGDSSHIHFAITDSTGHFGITVQETIPPANSGYSVQAFYLKLSSKKQELNMASAISLVIEDSANVLNTVLVSTAKPVFIRKADRFVFIPNKLLTNGADAMDIMRHTPLVQYDERSDAFSIINKPGTVIYINNKKSKVPAEMLIAQLRSLPAENIKSIEIITNPGSEYAAGTTGGVININIRRQLYEGWLGNLALLTDQSVYNTTMLNGAVNYRKGKLALQLIPFVNSSFNFNTSDNALDYTSGTQDVLKTRHYRRYLVLGGGLNMDYDINARNLLSFGGWWSNVDGKSNTRTLTSYTKANPLPNDSLLSSFNTGKDNYVYNYGSVNYHHLLDSVGGDAYLDLTVDYNNFSQKRDYNGLFDESNTGTRYRNNLPQVFHNLSERAELSRPLSKRVKLGAGVQYSNTHVENDLKYYNWSNNDYA
ncbi:MAG TPA: TonB-dependent receptor, partial [Chitinophagaceae bacterium]|nr:TonB-dependent receptor [Chitinophagaceae bacterium]